MWQKETKSMNQPHCLHPQEVDRGTLASKTRDAEGAGDNIKGTLVIPACTKATSWTAE